MSVKDDIIALINRAYREDEFINDFTGAVTSIMNAIIAFCNSVHDNIFFDTLDQEGVEWWEELMEITPTLTQSISDRRSKIQAKWLSKYHNDIVLMQRVCNAWKNGEVEVDFVGGKIQLKFVGGYGVPADLESLKESINEVKPAHLPYDMIYKYLLKKNIHHVLTKSEMETYLKSQYCNVGV